MKRYEIAPRVLFHHQQVTPPTLQTTTTEQSLKPQTEASQPQQPIPHIMISYNWGVQPLVLKISASLKAAGYKVWLDVEHMK